MDILKRHTKSKYYDAMKNLFLLAFVCLAISTTCIGQTTSCKIKIIQLAFEKSLQLIPDEITDSVLAFAKLTSSILVDGSEIKRFDIMADTSCCTYVGVMIIPYHQYFLTEVAVSRLNMLDIPLCCGIPVAIYVDDKELYRAMFWKTTSSNGNKSWIVNLTKDCLTVRVNKFMTSRNFLPACLLTTFGEK